VWQHWLTHRATSCLPDRLLAPHIPLPLAATLGCCQRWATLHPAVVPDAMPDLHSRRVIGRTVSRRMKRDLAIRVQKTAIAL
jgi:hypothetical protein